MGLCLLILILDAGENGIKETCPFPSLKSVFSPPNFSHSQKNNNDKSQNLQVLWIEIRDISSFSEMQTGAISGCQKALGSSGFIYVHDSSLLLQSI